MALLPLAFSPCCAFIIYTLVALWGVFGVVALWGVAAILGILGLAVLFGIWAF